MLNVAWRLFMCHHVFPVATGPEDLEMDVNTNVLHNTFKGMNVSRVLADTQNRYGEVSKLTNASKVKTTEYSFTYEMRYKDILKSKNAQPKKSSRR